jgi:signal transduction histidine kinase
MAFLRASDLERQRDEFLSLLSHELLTPLTSILGWAQVASHDVGDPALLARALESIARNALRQKALLVSLLDLAYYRGSRLVLDPEHTQLWRQMKLRLPSLPPCRDVQLSLFDDV